MPTVGVVVAAYQAERWLPATLESVVGQSFTDWSCVVVDDGSSDSTAEIVRRFRGRDERFHLVSQGNGGPSSARNRGMNELGRECHYIAFLDSDDCWLRESLHQLTTALETRPDAVGVAGLAELMDAHGDAVRPGEHSARLLARRRIDGWRTRAMSPDEDITLLSMAVTGSVWPPATALLRRCAVEQAGGFRADLRLQEDWDLYLRLTRQGPIVSLPRQVAWYRVHDSNLTGQTFDNLQAQQRVRRLAYESPTSARVQRRLVVRGWRLDTLGALHAQAYGLYRAMKGRRLRPLVPGLLGAIGLSLEATYPVVPRPHRLLLRMKLALRVPAPSTPWR